MGGGGFGCEEVGKITKQKRKKKKRFTRGSV